VGADIAAGSQDLNGYWALFVIQEKENKIKNKKLSVNQDTPPLSIPKSIRKKIQITSPISPIRFK